MPRYAVIDRGVVVGVLGASTPPTTDIPIGRLFVDVTELPEIRGGESYDATSGTFVSPVGPDVPSRLNKIESDIRTLKDVNKIL